MYDGKLLWKLLTEDGYLPAVVFGKKKDIIVDI